MEMPIAQGPDLAKDRGMGTHAQQEHLRRSNLAAADERWRRSRPALVVALYASWISFVVLLWFQGYPRWRVLALLGILGLALAMHAARACVRANGPFCAAVTAADIRLPLAMSLAAVALTGGLHSPLLVALPPTVSVLVVRCGWRRETAGALWALAAAGLVMLLAPGWMGPPVPERTFALVALVALVGTVAVHADYVVILGETVADSVRGMLRARDEVASQALTRARELELMSSQISHELKNPLGAIKALVQISARGSSDGDTCERLKVVSSEVERMREILDGYLSFSRPLECLQREDLSLGELADEVLSVLQGRAAAAGVGLHRRGDARVEADPRRLKEALLNLVANAVEASRRGDRVEVLVADHGGTVEVAVRDTGRGMPPAVVARLGTPFFTTRDQGTGLGVLLARRAFVQHGGALEYASAPDAGTTATGTLPRVHQEATENVPAAAGR
ncbi:histidine kinase [Anaeromyxobacter dehalogenans 2CP-1]|uniref:histidine kinase n=1 Tax=Anaeromyxobacter dehalogenans (strain ATCC BAA-258 / DSM 21875 / 2CP-1) TaxID=455488 RepID=B8JC96_ANAD2|nr:HAMP domain-containing sensor histidine kinase [Anaeromyxobacter dehalogenans]ACL65836.1 histidine kinase [Anaeromyxobacter dehalogenans 2CP-1]